MFYTSRCIDNRFICLELIIDNRFRIDKRFRIENRFRIESLTSESESNRIVRCQEIPTPTKHTLQLPAMQNPVQLLNSTETLNNFTELLLFRGPSFKVKKSEEHTSALQSH